MIEARTCPQCQAELPVDALEGLCPRCLGKLAFMIGAENNGGSPEAVSSAQSNSPGANVRRFGDYELLEEIARGGMGVVYKARQVSLNRIVAVKMILAWQFASDAAVKRFRAEAAAAAHLQHPHIVAVHEVGQHEGQHYFSMDYIEGQSLSALVRENPLSAARAARYVRIIAGAIHYAHQEGIVHRDLKPSNVLIDAADQPRVTDFGLAKQLTADSDLTTTGQVLGSPNYLPPEQASRKLGEIGPPSDVYSLGAILYHLLTGRPPFLAETLPEMLAQVVNTQPAAPRLLNPGIPRDLETICLKCMEKDPHRRYQTARALADELGRYLRGETILARPVHFLEEFWRWCRRKPALAGLGLAVTALLMIVALGSTLAALHLNRLRQEARQDRYVTDMNLALREFEEHNSTDALYALQRQKPKAGETDLRGFEWRHLWLMCRGDYPFKLPRHKQVVGSLVFSPDGKTLATFNWDKTNSLKVWNLETQRERFRLQDVTSLGGFSSNGNLFVVGVGDGSIRGHDADTGRLISSITNAGAIVAFAANADSVLTIDRNNAVKQFDLATGAMRLSLPHVARRYFDYGQGAPLAITPNGRLLAVIEPGKGSEALDMGINLWDAGGGVERVFLPDHRQIRTLQFSPDGRRLAVGDGQGLVRVWDVATREFTNFTVGNLPILSLAFSPDGLSLATGSSDDTIKLWDVATGAQKPKTFRGQIGAVWSLAFSPDGKRLASGSWDSPVRFWNLGNEPIESVTNLLADHVGNFTFSPDSKTMAGGCRDKTVRVWEVATMSVRAVLKNASFVVAFSPDGKNLLASTVDGTAQWWNIGTGTARPVPEYGGFANITAVDFSPDRRFAAIGLKDGRIQQLEINSGQIVATYSGHGDAVLSLIFSPTGDKLVSGSRDKTIMVWDLKTHKVLEVCPEHKGAVSGVAISQDGTRMASGCSASTIKFWDMAALKKSLKSISWHKSAISSLDFSPDGRTLASGSEDRTVALWNFARRQQMASFKFDDAIRLVVFSPDGNTLAIVTVKGTLQLLRTVTLEAADREDKAELE